MTKKILLSVALAVTLNSFAFAEGNNNDTTVGIAPVPIMPVYNGGFYLGLGYGYVNVSDDYKEYFPNEGLSIQTEVDYSSAMLQAGFRYSPFISFEFRYWLSFGDGDYNIDSSYPPLYSTPSGSYDEFDAWGIYLKPTYPFTPEFSAYGLLGFSGVYVSGEPGWDLLDESAFSWGLGASYDITPQIAIFADYVWLYDSWGDNGYDYYDISLNQDTNVDAFNVGVGYRF